METQLTHTEAKAVKDLRIEELLETISTLRSSLEECLDFVQQKHNYDNPKRKGNTNMMTEKEQMMDALSVFIRQRAGLEFGNYGDLQSYRQEQRSITKDRHQAFELFRYVNRSESITAERIKAEARNRLEWKNGKWEYTTGQYFPTEYRRAVCSMLSSVLWNWLREECQCETREKIQASAKREFSRAVAKRWFR